METKKSKIPSYEEFLKYLKEKKENEEPLYRKDILLLVLYDTIEIYKCVFNGHSYCLVHIMKLNGLCNAIYNVIEYTFGKRLCYRHLKIVFPLFTKENALKFSNYQKTDPDSIYWFENIDWKESGREAFLKWLIEQYLDDTEDITEIVNSLEEFK